jgi:hypothetical protein
MPHYEPVLPAAGETKEAAPRESTSWALNSKKDQNMAEWLELRNGSGN